RLGGHGHPRDINNDGPEFGCRMVRRRTLARRHRPRPACFSQRVGARRLVIACPGGFLLPWRSPYPEVGPERSPRLARTAPAFPLFAVAKHLRLHRSAVVGQGGIGGGAADTRRIGNSRVPL